MNTKFPAGQLTNEVLLSVMPFNSGYLLEEDALTPMEDSVTFAALLQSLQYYTNPLKQYESDMRIIN